MAVRFVAPRVPLVDPKTGIISREWYLLFQQLFNLAGSGSVSNDEGPQILPATPGLEVALSAINASENWTANMPPSQQIFYAAEDVLPVIGSLREEVAMLRAALNDLRQGVVIL